MSKIKKLSFKQKTGLLSELQSDTIFGHFCWRLLHSEGKEKLESFLKNYISENENLPVFTISDGFPGIKDEIFFPIPIVRLNIESSNSNSKKEKIIKFLKQKELKKISRINLKELNLFLSGDYEKFIEKLENNLIKEKHFPKLLAQLRTNVKIRRETYGAEDKALFGIESRSIIGTKEQNVEYEMNWNVLIKILDEEKFTNFNCEKYLKEVFELGFGRKKNIGFGEFFYIEVTSYDLIIEPKESDGFVNLSNYLPIESDKITKFNYKQFLKYTKFGEEKSQSSDPFKKPIIFFKPGSVFFTDQIKDFYGRCTIPGEISESFSKAIQNGYSFSLRAKLNNV